jgi:hypothetical protein
MTLEIDCPTCSKDFWIELEPTRVRTTARKPYAMAATCPHCRGKHKVEFTLKPGRVARARTA